MKIIKEQCPECFGDGRARWISTPGRFLEAALFNKSILKGEPICPVCLGDGYILQPVNGKENTLSK